jgi:hypothetical protein
MDHNGSQPKITRRLFPAGPCRADARRSGKAPLDLTRRQFLAGQAAMLVWLGTAWTRLPTNAGQSVPDGWTPSDSVETIRSADLRYLYSAAEPGRENVRSAPVADVSAAAQRIAARYPKMAGWLRERQGLIRTALQEPEIVFRHLPYRRRSRHWLEMFAVKDVTHPGRYLAITVSLATLPDDTASACHKIIRIVPARASYFWTRDASGRSMLKARWLSAAQP